MYIYIYIYIYIHIYIYIYVTFIIEIYITYINIYYKYIENCKIPEKEINFYLSFFHNFFLFTKRKLISGNTVAI